MEMDVIKVNGKLTELDVLTVYELDVEIGKELLISKFDIWDTVCWPNVLYDTMLSGDKFDVVWRYSGLITLCPCPIELRWRWSVN